MRGLMEFITARIDTEIESCDMEKIRWMTMV